MGKARAPQPTVCAQTLVCQTLHPGEIAIGATAGNGHDTLFLANTVGPRGSVYAFDIQTEALEKTAATTANVGNVTLLLHDHANMREVIPVVAHGRVGAVMFNLGYLPGGDKSITTLPSSTVLAIRGSLELLREGGVLTVIAYPGHRGGEAELAVVTQLFHSLPPEFLLHEMQNENSIAPRLFCVHKPRKSG